MTASTLPLPNLRKMFVPDPGYTMIDVDLERADAQVVAAEADDKELRDLFASGLDVHSENAKQIFKLNREPTYQERQKAKQGVHACLTEDHEVLTPEGWKPITEKPDYIMCWDKEGESLGFRKVKSWYDDVSDTELLEWDTPAYSQKVTWDHKMPFFTSNKYWLAHKARNLPKTARLPKSGYYENTQSSISPDMVRLYCAIHADGSRSKLQYRFHLKKSRKIERLHKLLDRLGLEYSYNEYKDGSTNTAFRLDEIPKTLGSYVLDWNLECMKAYVEEALLWDGSVDEDYMHKRHQLNTADEENVIWFRTMCHLVGKASQTLWTTRCWAVSVNNRPYFRYTKPKMTQEKVRVLCPETETGFFMVQRNGKISITGNTNYGVSSKTLAPYLGSTVMDAENFINRWFEAHPKIKQWHDRVMFQLQTERTVKNAFGYRIYFFDRINISTRNQALAWLAQSVVAIATNKGLVNIDENLSASAGSEWDVQLLLQVHDSIVCQAPTEKCPTVFDKILEQMSVEIPYNPPLFIPNTLEASEKSWGDVIAYKKWLEQHGLAA